MSVCQPYCSWSSITINCSTQCDQLVIENAIYCDAALQQWKRLDEVWLHSCRFLDKSFSLNWRDIFVINTSHGQEKILIWLLGTSGIITFIQTGTIKK